MGLRALYSLDVPGLCQLLHGLRLSLVHSLMATPEIDGRDVQGAVAPTEVTDTPCLLQRRWMTAS